jgi:hypothetical protein
MTPLPNRRTVWNVTPLRVAAVCCGLALVAAAASAPAGAQESGSTAIAPQTAQIALATVPVGQLAGIRLAPNGGASGAVAHRLPAERLSESARIRRHLEFRLAPQPVVLTNSLQNGPALKQPPGSQQQTALKGHGTADFADTDIEYNWQIKGSKLKVMIPF